MIGRLVHVAVLLLLAIPVVGWVADDEGATSWGQHKEVQQPPPLARRQYGVEISVAQDHLILAVRVDVHLLDRARPITPSEPAGRRRDYEAGAGVDGDRLSPR